MYFCILHNWNSSEQPCPACFKTQTITSTNVVINHPIEEAIKDKEDELMPFNEVVTNYWGYATNEAIKQYPDDLQRQVSYREGIFKGLSKSNQKEAISEEAIRNAYQMGWTDRENKLSDGMFNPKEDEDNYMALLKSTKA